MFRRDYLLRQIDQLVALVRRMMQLKVEQKYEEAFVEAKTAYDQIFAAHKQLILYADSATLAALIGEPELVHALARAMRAEGELFEAKGDPDMAAQRYRRALELHLEAGVGPGLAQGDKDFDDLIRRVDATTLDARYSFKLERRKT